MIAIKGLLIKRVACALLCLVLVMYPASAFASYTSGSLAEKESEQISAAKAEVFEASISEIKIMLEKGEITSEQLCEVYIERINTYDKDTVKLNSVISINTNAIAQAKQMDAERSAGHTRGILHGIPILIKDNIDVSGFPTTLGKTTLSESAAEADASAVAYLVGQGAIILGKTNMSTSDTVTRYTVSALLGETRNAYDTAYSAGGSSGGSAVAVSANLAVAALATDTNGSMTYPAALNGTVALRPTHGLVDYSGCANVVKARDVVGPVTKSVEDAALLMDILTDSATEMTYSKALSKDALKGKTVAVIKELSQYTYNSPNEFKNADKEITGLFEKALEDIKAQGANVVTVSIPKLFSYYNTCRESLSGSGAAKAALGKELETLLSENSADAFVFPAYLSSPLPSGFDKYGSHKSESLTYLNCGAYLPSLVGLPAVCVPMGMHSSGVSAGLEFVSLSGEDAEILSLAYSYEQATALRISPEQTPNLYKKVEKPEEPQDKEETEPVSSQTVSEPIENKPSSVDGQIITVALIIAAILALCVWVLIFGRYKGGKKNIHKNRHF